MGALLTTALLVPILLVPSNATLLVDELMEDPSDRIGKEISVRGEVVNGSIDLDNHRLVLNGTSYDLDVDLLHCGGLGWIIRWPNHLRPGEHWLWTMVAPMSSSLR